MRFNKFLHVILVCLLVTVCSMQLSAQNDKGVVSMYDSSVIPAKRMPQQQEFLSNTYSFPAKPRNQWEAGLSVGALGILGDIPSIFPTFGVSAHVRKSLNYLFSLRLQYLNGHAKGQMWQGSTVNTKNTAWLDNSVPGFQGSLPAGKGYNGIYLDASGNLVPISPTLNGGQAQQVFTNYKTHIQDLSLQGIFTLNNIRFHKAKTKLTIYGGGGVGITAYRTMVNALDAGGNNYTNLFNEVIALYAGNADLSRSEKKGIRNKLKDGMDNSYETEAQSDKKRHGGIGKNSILPSGTVFAGISYKLSNRINLALEDRHTLIKSDLLDGQQWQVHPRGDVSQTRDFDSYNYFSLGLNYNVGSKSVEPLWWLNPLDYAYSEINQPKHMKLPKPVFDDTDGDGITDQLDREPNTPAGCPVDTHGVTKDTDGDGVPDCKDKQMITPTECQPVDAEGIGKCPEPACCDSLKTMALNFKPACPDDYPGIRLKKLSLDKSAKTQLDLIANKLKAYPECSITIQAYPRADKKAQLLTSKKIDLIKNYLVEKAGINIDRIDTNMILDGGDTEVIDFK